MNSNYFICRNEVYIEGESVGEFESFSYTANARVLGTPAELVLPLYAIGAGKRGEAASRMRAILSTSPIKPCAKVEVYMWYEGYKRQLKYSGFIEHIGDGFPTKLYLNDNSFILRFGQVQKAWDGNATLQQIAKDCIPIAQKAFAEERKKQGLTMEIPELTYNVTNTNVQAVTTSLSFRNWGARSPYETVQKLMQLLCLYGGVTKDYNLFIGAGVENSTRPIERLDTRINVIGRDIVPVDGRFVDYDVKITGILANGKKYTATGGYGTSRSTKSNDGFDKKYGQPFRGYSTLNTPKAIQEFADRQLAMLKGFRNKGKIVCLLYPRVELLDQVQYYDYSFPKLGGLYYVMGYSFVASEEGYFQTLDVTDQIFLI